MSLWLWRQRRTGGLFHAGICVSFICVCLVLMFHTLTCALKISLAADHLFCTMMTTTTTMTMMISADFSFVTYLLKSCFSQKTTVKVNKFHHLSMNRKTVKNEHTLCLCILLCAGEPVSLRTTPTAAVQERSGLTTCSVLVMRRH